MRTPFGAGPAELVRALREGRAAPPRGLPAFPGQDLGDLTAAMDRADFTPSPGALRAALADVARPAHAALPAPDAWLVVGTSGIFFLGEYMGQGSEWLGSCGDIACDLAQDLGLERAPLTLSTACSSSANALLLAAQAIARGECPSALVVGFEALSPIALNGFRSLMLLDPRGCRPFDRHRAGLHLGEGLAALSLQASSPDFRGARAVILGGAHVCAAMGPAGQAPDADAMHAAMSEALGAAQCEPRDIVAIKAHGLGSTDSDEAEAVALHRLYGALPSVTSLKGSFGHTLGASGALETAAFLACLEAGFVPPAAGFEAADPALSLVPLRAPLAARSGPYQLNFFGFGASYVSLIVGFES